MKTPEYEFPFRWNIQQRANLGRLLEGPREPAYPADALAEITRECARIVAFSENADLCFVGRSLENLFDYLSGLLSETSWAERLQLLHFSKYESADVQAKELAGLRHYFEHLGFDPHHFVHRERPVAFVDIVASGATFGTLLTFWYQWTKETGEDWEAVKRKIRLIGLTRRTKTSPHTWRWHQHLSWRNLVSPRTIHTVAIPVGFWNYFGGQQKKTTSSYTHSRWGSNEAAQPDYQEEHLLALRLAVQLFDLGRQKRWRRTFAQYLSREQAMVFPWFLTLVREIKR